LFAGAGWCTARRPSFVTRIHAYAYAGGNAVSRIDPTGKDFLV
jgi:hypothetical protein